MIVCVNKETRFNLRVTEDFRREIETLAHYYGLTPSAMAHSLLVRSIRSEKTAHPEIFGINETKPQGARFAKIKAETTSRGKKTKTG